MSSKWLLYDTTYTINFDSGESIEENEKKNTQANENFLGQNIDASMKEDSKPLEIIEAENITDGLKIAIENKLVKEANFSEFPLKMVNASIQALADFREKFPEIEINYLGGVVNINNDVK